MLKIFNSTAWRLGILLAASAVCMPPNVWSQPPQAAPSETSLPKKEELQSLLKDLDASSLDDAVKTKAREFYQKAIQELDNLETLKKSLEAYQQEIQSVPQSLQRVKAELSQPLVAPPRPPLETVPLDRLEEALAKLVPQLRAKEEEHSRLESDRKARETRLVDLPKLVTEAQKELPQVERRLSEPPAMTEPAEAAQARRISDQIRKAVLEVSLKVWESDRQAYQATVDLAPAQRDLRAREVAALEQEAQELRTAVNQRRKREASEQEQEARLNAIGGNPALAEQARHTAQLAKERRTVADRIDKATRDLEKAREKLSQWQGKFERSREKVEAVGLTHASGQLLRREQATLPSVYEIERNIYLREATIGEARLQKYEHEEQRSGLADVDQAVDKLLTQADLPQNDALRSSARDMLAAQRQLLENLTSDDESWLQLLLELNETEERLATIVRDYRSFIAERVLWIRSADVLGTGGWRPPLAALSWLVSLPNWREALFVLGQDFLAYPFYLPLLLVVVSPLIYVQGKCRRSLNEIGRLAARGTCVNQMLSLRAALLTLLISLPWPLVLGYLAWRISGSYAATDFVRALGSALWAAAALVLGLQLVRQACRPMGLAAAHIGWSDARVRLLWRQLRWLLWAAVPLASICVLMEAQTTGPLWSESLGRGAMIASLLLAAWFLFRVFQPADGLLAAVFGPQSLIARFKRGWQVLIASGPLLLGLLAAAGYYYTAQQLGLRLLGTLGVIALVLWAGGMLTRWVLLNRRRLAMEQLRQRRAAAAAQQAAREENTSAPPAPDPEEELVNLAALSEQTRNLLNTALVVVGLAGTWLIWGDILPALSLLHSVPIWPGATTPTLADVLLAVLVVVVTYIATKNVPGLLELSLLQHLPLDAGARYAITTLCRYVITIVGIVLACATVGIDWQSVQWLVAAVGVGLGFGLQEIFANFVSGIILLFERPIRVGDIVTLGETSGIVTRIRMRATTITDWDRKEYIVPNKDLVTGRLLNWTLSDQMNRIVINVGVAYGSDTSRAREILLAIAREQPLILRDPAPMASFEGFGDSSLTMVLRCFLPDLTRRLDVVHDLHTTIHQRFAEAGIEIAFPQRDLNIRLLPRELSDALHAGSNGASAGPKARH